jgi:hypothetical protein
MKTYVSICGMGKQEGYKYVVPVGSFYLSASETHQRCFLNIIGEPDSIEISASTYCQVELDIGSKMYAYDGTKDKAR